VSGGLTEAEIVRIVNRYIGVSGGYLGLPDRFTYRTHAEFYAEYCDLSVDLSPFEGTTRETFMAALASLSSRDQASSSGSHPMSVEPRPADRRPTGCFCRTSSVWNRGRLWRA
jgi:hypothetical protein